MSPFIGAIPVNQSDSLPVFSLAQYATTGGTMVFSPGQVVRYFSPADTGFTGQEMSAPDPLDASYVSRVGGYLDVRGCNRFTVRGVVQIDQPYSILDHSRYTDAIIAVEIYMQTPFAVGAVQVDGITGNQGVAAYPKAATLTFNPFTDVTRPVYGAPPPPPPPPIIPYYKPASQSFTVPNGQIGVVRIWARCNGGVVKPVVDGVNYTVTAKLHLDLWAQG